MAKTSKTIPQKEKASFFSSRPSDDKAPVEPLPHEYVHGPCMTKDVILRPSSGEEETKSPVPKPGKDKKRKIISLSEDPKLKPRRVRRKVIALTMDSVQKLRDEEEENASALTVRPKDTVEVTKPSEPTTAAKIKPRVEEASKKKMGEDPELQKVEIVSRPSATTPNRAGSETPKIDQSVPSDLLETITADHLPSLPTFSEEALREARELKTRDIGGGSSVGDPFRDLFTGVDDASDISDASILLKEAQRLLSRFRADLSQCETELQKVSEERNALKLLCGQNDETIKDLQADLAKAREEEAELDKQVSILLIKYGLDLTVEANTLLSQLQQKVERIELFRGEVNQVKADCDRWKENMDRLAAEKETSLAKLSSTKVQLRGIKEKSSAPAKRIEELETGLAEAKAEIEKTKVMEDKSIAMYRTDTEAAQMQLREASDREQ
ncbi:kinesin-like protein KIN-14N [Nicotiana tomentosiformis]|uniref:kinesin-like protein KIN-14N n=1 Tax=Nicotiana tomentosiformis TaxID=4098 RepID=UPI00388CE4E8